MRLENKIALVTAAASGMGRAGVIRFAAEGAQVAAVDIDQAALDAVVKEVTDAGGDAVAIKADLTKDNECTVLSMTQLMPLAGWICCGTMLGIPAHRR